MLLILMPTVIYTFTLTVTKKSLTSGATSLVNSCNVKFDLCCRNLCQNLVLEKLIAPERFFKLPIHCRLMKSGVLSALLFRSYFCFRN